MRVDRGLLLTDGEVEMRLISVRDGKRLRELLKRNRSWLHRWEATIPGVSLEQPGDAPLSSAIRYHRRRMRQGHGVPFVVIYGGELVGQLTISDIAWGAVRSGQIGYWIDESYAGRGIIPTATRLAITHALTTLGLHRIEICLRPENSASRRVVEKLGLRYEGRRERYIHIDGAWRDHDCYALTAEELDTIAE